ncbi:hypothetical protein LTR28_001901 [Elasticomyces elasticus]|nr:hypothetical protein LTR28_001901 [Elasticomyces elasticus]
MADIRRASSSNNSLPPKAEVNIFLATAVNESSVFRKTVDQTFDNESIESFYKPMDSYDGRHRYDPDLQWEPEEEKRVVRKIDYRICSWVCLMFFALQLDRGNISQALNDNMLDDLGLTTNDYNTGQTIFYLTFFAAELPSQIVSKKIGPANWIPVQVVCWSLVVSLQAFLSGRDNFWACSALLGLIEGGLIPDNILYLSYFYTGFELPFNEREEKIMVNRILRDDPGKGDMHNRQAITHSLLWEALKDYHMWPIYLLGLSWLLPLIPMSAYLTLQLKSAGFKTLEVNLLIIPAYLIFILYVHAMIVAITSRNAGVWDAMTHEENAHYLSTTADKGNKRLDF